MKGLDKLGVLMRDPQIAAMFDDIVCAMVVLSPFSRFMEVVRRQWRQELLERCRLDDDGAPIALPCKLA